MPDALMHGISSFSDNNLKPLNTWHGENRPYLFRLWCRVLRLLSSLYVARDVCCFPRVKVFPAEEKATANVVDVTPERALHITQNFHVEANDNRSERA